MLRCKAEGWKVFCTRLNLPPLLMWECLPGFEHVQAAWKMAEQAAFVEEGFLSWLNAKRKPGDPILTESPITVAKAADANERMFRDRVRWWSGDGSSH